MLIDEQASISPVDGPKDQNREKLREKIATGQARLAERSIGDYARDARDNATGFVREHPLVVVGAALAVGVVLAAVIPGPGRRLSQRVGKTLANRASAIAAIAAELGVAYAASLMNAAGSAAQSGQDKLEDFGVAIGDDARKVRRETTQRIATATDRARSFKRDTANKARRTLRDLRGSIT